MGPVAVAPNHRSGCLLLVDALRTLKGDRVQGEREDLRILDKIPSIQLCEDAIETASLLFLEVCDAIDIGYPLERPLLAQKHPVISWYIVRVE